MRHSSVLPEGLVTRVARLELLSVIRIAHHGVPPFAEILELGEEVLVSTIHNVHVWEIEFRIVFEVHLPVEVADVSVHLRRTLRGELAMEDHDRVAVDLPVFAQEGMFHVRRFEQIDGPFDVSSIELVRIPAIHDEVFAHFPSFGLGDDVGQGLGADSGRSVVTVVHDREQMLFERGALAGPSLGSFQGLFDDLIDVFLASLERLGFRQGPRAEDDPRLFFFFFDRVLLPLHVCERFPFVVVRASLHGAAEERFLDAHQRRFHGLRHGVRGCVLLRPVGRRFRSPTVHFVPPFVGFVPPFLHSCIPPGRRDRPRLHGLFHTFSKRFLPVRDSTGDVGSTQLPLFSRPFRPTTPGVSV